MQEKDESKQAERGKTKASGHLQKSQKGSSAVRIRKVPSGETTITEKANPCFKKVIKQPGHIIISVLFQFITALNINVIYHIK